MAVDEIEVAAATEQVQLSLSTAAARNLATTTKTPPQMQGITSRWLLRVLPWVQVSAGTYRVNRRLSYSVGRGRVGFEQNGVGARVVAPTLRELPLLRGFSEDDVLVQLAGGFAQREVGAGEVIVTAGEPAEQVFLIAHGRVNRVGTGKYGEERHLGVLADGDQFGDSTLVQSGDTWEYTATAATACTLFVLSQQQFEALATQSEALRAQVDAFRARGMVAQDRHGQAAVDLASGHDGEPALPGTFVDYELAPREYELAVAQTVLRVHSRVADLFNEPMNQVEHQLRLTVEELRERQEHELVNNPQFGLLDNVAYEQRIQTQSGPPTPDDLDELLSRRRSTRFFFAHPRTIAAIGREWSKRGLYPVAADINGSAMPAWRGVPILPCNKIPISDQGTSTIIAMRTGEDDQGVVGLHQVGIPDEYEPGLNVRFMGITEKAIISYLVSAYFSVAVLVPDALGVLENVQINHRD
ncbi:MAG: cyclic nucleotide-binding domain-containing protein [Chloroflexi bacterium]|nr:MAG: cyclic nucleotide-binding domain-containing protein [Chloroflexota bacterium]